MSQSQRVWTRRPSFSPSSSARIQTRRLGHVMPFAETLPLGDLPEPTQLPPALLSEEGARGGGGACAGEGGCTGEGGVQVGQGGCEVRDWLFRSVREAVRITGEGRAGQGVACEAHALNHRSRGI